MIEILPPAVNTDLGGKGLNTFGVELNEFADAVIKQLKKGKLEATYGLSTELSRANRGQLEAVFNQINQSR